MGNNTIWGTTPLSETVTVEMSHTSHARSPSALPTKTLGWPAKKQLHMTQHLNLCWSQTVYREDKVLTAQLYTEYLLVML